MCVISLAYRNMEQRLRGRERSFLCNVCKRSFMCRSNLDIHIRVHTVENDHFRVKYVRKVSVGAVT